MSLRDQPYIPLYVDKFVNDENLRECSPGANGVLIRVMCLLHKADSEIYGTLKLKKQYENYLIRALNEQERAEFERNFAEGFATAKLLASAGHFAVTGAVHFAELLVRNFAKQLAKQMPFDSDEIEKYLTELVENNVVFFNGIYLCQKGMMKQGKVSLARSLAGCKGQERRQKNARDKKIIIDEKNEKNEKKFAEDFAAAKVSAKPIIIIQKNNKQQQQEKEKGLSNNMIGGAGGKKNLGKRKNKNQNDSDMIQQTLEIGHMLENYFTLPKFAQVRERVAMTHYLTLEQLRKWAMEFNKFLIASANFLDETGQTVRQENEWCSHFNNWLGTQNTQSEPESRLVDKKTNKINSNKAPQNTLVKKQINEKKTYQIPKRKK